MEKILKVNDTLESMARQSGASEELYGQSENSMDPIDKEDLQQRTIRFNPNNLAWVTDDSSFFTCIRFDSGEVVDDKEIIDDRRFL